MSKEANPAQGEQKFRYFKDVECSQPLYIISFPEPVVRGEEKAELTVYAKNITSEELDNLNFIPQDPDLKIEKSSDRVEPKGTIMLKFIFAPKEDRNKELNTEFIVRGRAIMRGES